MKTLVALCALAILLIAPPCLAQGTAYFWAGGYFEDEVWHDTVYVYPHQWLDIPIYFMGDPDGWISMLHYPLAARYDLIDQFNIHDCSYQFWPFTSGQFGWSLKEFGEYQDDILESGENYVNQLGYHSLSFIGFARTVFTDPDWLHSEIPIPILSFNIHIVDEDSLSGNIICDALDEGSDPYYFGEIYCEDTTEANSYTIINNFACFINPYYT